MPSAGSKRGVCRTSSRDKQRSIQSPLLSKPERPVSISILSMLNDGEKDNFELFRDCLATPLIERSAAEPQKTPRKRKGGNGRKTSKLVDGSSAVERNDVEELAEFIDYIALEIFTCLPLELRSLSHSIYSHSSILQETYALPLTTSLVTSRMLTSFDPSIAETLTAYTIIASPDSFATMLTPVLGVYVSTLITAPPVPSQTRSLATSCEICERTWVPLTYHHLIPKAVHAKVLKRGWHPKEKLNDVAWICRACHSFVHRVCTNEELARDWWSIELLMNRDDLRAFADWVGKVRWKKR